MKQVSQTTRGMSVQSCKLLVRLEPLAQRSCSICGWPARNCWLPPMFLDRHALVLGTVCCVKYTVQTGFQTKYSTKLICSDKQLQCNGALDTPLTKVVPMDTHYLAATGAKTVKLLTTFLSTHLPQIYRLCSLRTKAPVQFLLSPELK